jgi:hypothetical protein
VYDDSWRDCCNLRKLNIHDSRCFCIDLTAARENCDGSTALEDDEMTIVAIVHVESGSSGLHKNPDVHDEAQLLRQGQKRERLRRSHCGIPRCVPECSRLSEGRLACLARSDCTQSLLSVGLGEHANDSLNKANALVAPRSWRT